MKKFELKNIISEEIRVALISEEQDMTFKQFLIKLDATVEDAMRAVKGENGSDQEILPTRGDILQNFTLFRNYIGSLIKRHGDNPTKLRFLKENQTGIPSQEEVDKFFSDTQNEMHYLNQKPVDGQKGKGSARSVHGFDIGSQIIKAVQMGILQKGGGHKMAGGFTIDIEKIDIFREYLIKNYEKIQIDILENENLYLDSIIAPSALNEDFYHDINFLGPFGAGNNEPKFVVENVKVIRSDIIKQNHIKSLLCGKDGSVFKSFEWNAIKAAYIYGERYVEKAIEDICTKMVCIELLMSDDRSVLIPEGTQNVDLTSKIQLWQKDIETVLPRYREVVVFE